ncbi:MAG: hypothetical protein U0270_07610 [Labilithrix sp.]
MPNSRANWLGPQKLDRQRGERRHGANRHGLQDDVLEARRVLHVVPRRRALRLVPEPGGDPRRVVARLRAPGAERRAKRPDIERQELGRTVHELGARDAGERQVRAQLIDLGLDLPHVLGVDVEEPRPRSIELRDHHLEQRPQLGMDRHLAHGLPVLGRFDLSALHVARSLHEEDGAIDAKANVIALQPVDLGGA